MKKTIIKIKQELDKIGGRAKLTGACPKELCEGAPKEYAKEVYEMLKSYNNEGIDIYNETI